MEPIDVIKRYFKINSALTRRLEYETHEFIATCTEGIILGKAEEYIYIAKTFISEDIMRKDQIDLKERWLPYLKKYKSEI